jgi:DNA-directed RNA polymerase subunit K/omega
MDICENKVIDKKYTRVKDDDRISLPRLSKYEIYEILGFRSNQIYNGSKIMIKNINGMSDEKIVMSEIENEVCPISIVRYIDNTYEIWTLKELVKNSKNIINYIKSNMN